MEQTHEHEAGERRENDTVSARLPRELRGAAEAAGRAAENIGEARQRLHEVRRQATDSLHRAGDAARAYTRDNPTAVTLAAFGVGLGAGLLLAQRRTSPPNWRATVPAVAAIADAVLEVFDRRR